MQLRAQGPPRASEQLHPYLDCLFLFGSSAAKMWTVPWSLETQMREASWLKLILQRTQTAAGFLLRQTHSPATDTTGVGHSDTAGRKCTSSALRSGYNVQLPHSGAQHRNGSSHGEWAEGLVSLLLGQSHLCPGCSSAQQDVGTKLPLPPSSPQLPLSSVQVHQGTPWVSVKFSIPQFPPGLSSHSLATATAPSLLL